MRRMAQGYCSLCDERPTRSTFCRRCRRTLAGFALLLVLAFFAGAAFAAWLL